MIIPRTLQKQVGDQLNRSAEFIGASVEEIIPGFVMNGQRVGLSKSDYGKKNWSVSITVEFESPEADDAV